MDPFRRTVLLPENGRRSLSPGTDRPHHTETLSRPAPPIPVLLAITELDDGGAERALVRLALGLDRARWRASVVALSPEGPLAEPLRAAGIPVTCLGAGPRHPWSAISGLAKSIRKARPALIQSFLFHANFAARLAARVAGSPLVLGGLRVAERGKGWHGRLDRLTFGLSAGSICVSEGVRRFSIEAGLPPDRLFVVPNGVDVEAIARAPAVDRRALGIEPGAHLALFVGRLDPQKDVATLLKAAALVTAARADWSLALVGDGPDSARLRDLARSLRLPEGRVRWLGRRGDVPGLLKTADLLALPSRWEGMPNVVLEAMAAGKAVVATAVEGSEDLVVPGRTGWLVPPGDPGALAAALIEAADDPDRRMRFGQSGRVRVEAEFSEARFVAAHERIWSEVLGVEPPSPART